MLLKCHQKAFYFRNKIMNSLGFSSSEPHSKVFWRDSATLLLAKPAGQLSSAGSNQAESKNQKSNGIEFLMTSRSAKSKFMPGGLCFPGGTVSDIDHSNKWLDLYRKFDELDTIQGFSWLSPNANKPEIYFSNRNSSGTEGNDKENSLPKQVSLRITAIRETFEECGILLCKSATKAKLNDQDRGDNSFIKLSDDFIIKWQTRIKANPEDFLTLCHELQVLPNLYSLYEWNNWLTPITYKPGPKGAPRRFDTIFYFTILSNPTPPNVIIDLDEVADFEWSTGQKLVEGHISGNRPLMPPQLYEIYRLMGFQSLEDLKQLIKSRQEFGIQRWCPYLRKAADGVFGCLPGDDLLPKTYDIYNYNEMEKVDKTLAELEKSSKHLHRWQMGKDGSYNILINTHTLGQKYNI